MLKILNLVLVGNGMRYMVTGFYRNTKNTIFASFF